MNTVDRIKAICKERKIPISRLERDLGFGNAYISQLRKGDMPFERLTKVAEYLHVSEKYLSTGEESKTPTFSPEHLELITEYEKLSDEDKSAIMRIIKSINKK